MARTRRALLAALSVTLAGCSGTRTGTPTRSPTPTDATPTRPPTDSPTPSPTDREAPERVALDDDRVRWRVDLPGERATEPAVAGDQLFVATGSPLAGTPTGEETATGHLTALSLPDGEIAWHRSLPDPPTDGVEVHSGAIYLPVGRSTGLHGVDQRLLRVDSDGTVGWQSSTRDSFVRVYGFDAGSAYLGTADDHLQATGETTYAVDLETGAEQWAVEGGDASGGRVAGETLYADYGGLALASLATADGSTNWQHSGEPLHGYERALPQASGHLFAAVEQADSYGMVGVDAEDGTTSWSHGLEASSPFVVTSATAVGETVVATEYDGLLFARDAATGEARWRQEFGEKLQAPLQGEGTLYCAVLDGPVVAVDADSGDERWRAELAGAGYGRLALAAETLLVGSRDGGETSVEARRLSDGHRRWKRTVPGRTVAFERTGNTLAVLTDDRSVFGIALG